MKFFNFIISKGYELLHCVDSEGWETFRTFNGESRSHAWTAIRVRRVRMTPRWAFRPSDSPYCGSHVLIFRRSAVDVLRDMLDAHGELLPLKDETGIELYAYNPRALDALDQVLSTGPRDENGKLEAAGRHVFIPSVVEGVDVFKLAIERGGDIYLSDRFVERWKETKLKGLDFRLVWDSDLPPEQQPNVWTSKPIKL